MATIKQPSSNRAKLSDSLPKNLTTAIRNRVKGLKMIEANKLIGHEFNWRKHPTSQTNALKQIVNDVGFVAPILAIQTAKGYKIIDGHLRTGIAGNQKVPVVVLDLTEAEAKKVLATIDNITGMAQEDPTRLHELVLSLSAGDQKIIDDVLAETPLWKLEFNLDAAAESDAEPQINRAEELNRKWKVKRNDLWHINEHWLLCGDSTKREDVERVMDGEKARMTLTSPPYAVGKEYEKGVTFEKHLELLRGFADCAIAVTVPGGFIFTNFGDIAPQSHAGVLTGSHRQCIYLISKDYWRIFHEERKCDLYAQRIWYKQFNRLKQPFWTYHTSIPHYQEWEHIWTWRTPGGEGDQVFDWDISVRAVWDIGKESIGDAPLTRHVAGFPIGLPERALKAHSQRGDIVYEPFGGSGTTMVACNNLGRKCRMMEISPAYCSVILQRMQDAFGITGELIEGSSENNNGAKASVK